MVYLKSAWRKSWFSVIAFAFAFILLIGRAADAQIYTVGPHGTYCNIQGAVNAAIGNPGTNEIHVEQGSYTENIRILSMNSGSLTITGGWNDSFTARDTDNTLTTIDGNAAGRVIDIQISGGLLTIEGFTIENGGNNTYGSGLNIETQNAAQVTINNNRIQNNTSSGQSTMEGGGIHAYVQNNTQLSITGNLISYNSVVSTEGSCWGAGINLNSYDNAVFNVTGNVIEGNSATAFGWHEGVGFRLNTSSSGSSDFTGNTVRNNEANGTGYKQGIAGRIGITSTGGTITARRNLCIDNRNNGGGSSVDLELYTHGTATLLFTDSVVAGASGDGIRFNPSDSSTLRLTNLTIADNGGTGLYKYPVSGTASLYNTIIYNNTTNTNSLTGLDTGNNLIGVDPMFVNSAGREYRLMHGSPAINTGANSPPGGLGSLDLAGNPRISNGTVDIGAYEYLPRAMPCVPLLLLDE
ncbi:MAG: hypothetical protein BA861_12775 [Desulfobacterales bacterium S3730MH5]|nr:MAG: hypothetical protein BA861_12775 [Desulfobacterales bacterium S3730MH5]